MPGLFVAATGTEVGKTFVAAGLIRAARRAGQAVEALKPVVSGFDPADPSASDPAVLLAALGRAVTPESIAMISPWRFRAPLSPDMAAALEGRALSLDAIEARCRDALATDRLTIIEGIGGVMVPLERGRTTLDLMAALSLPHVLVSPTGLGAISHLLSALAALTTRGLAPAAILLNETPGSSVPLDLTLGTLAGFVPAADLFVLRHLSAQRPDRQDNAFDALLAHVAKALPVEGASPRRHGRAHDPLS